jgi:hypothetical protein
MFWRNFRGLPYDYFKPEFDQIENKFLRESSFNSLNRAQDDQGPLFDFSMSEFNLSQRSVGEGDLSILILMENEISTLNDDSSYQVKFINHTTTNISHLALIIVSSNLLSSDDPIYQRVMSLNPLAKII